jgi:hypothetical protein
LGQNRSDVQAGFAGQKMQQKEDSLESCEGWGSEDDSLNFKGVFQSGVWAESKSPKPGT